MTILVPISYTGRGDQVRPTQSSLEALTAARSIDTVHAIVVCEPGVSETLAEAIAPYGVDVLHAAEDKDAFSHRGRALRALTPALKILAEVEAKG